METYQSTGYRPYHIMSETEKESNRIRSKRYVPAGYLRPHVQCYWTMTSQTLLQSPVPHRVVPDGCVDIIFDLNNNSPEQAASIVGTMTTPILAQLRGKVDYVAIRFLPGAAFTFLENPMDSFTDRLVPLEALWPRDAHRLAECLISRSRIEDRIQLLEQHLTRLLGAEQRSDAAVEAAVHGILTRRGNVRTSEVASNAGCSQRQLRRKFYRWVGVAPKVLCRIIRFQHVMRLLRSDLRRNPLFAALDSGYYDQAHFIHEFNSYSGLNPSEFVKITNS